MSSTTRLPRPAGRLVAAALKPASRALLVLAGTSALAAAAAPGVAHAGVPCVSHHATPVGDDWNVGFDGALDGPVTPPQPTGGVLFDGGFGTLRVNGAAYPEVSQGDGCTVAGTTVNYPARIVGGLHVTRSVSVVGGRLRHIDTIRNTTGQPRVASVGFLTAVAGSQTPVDTTNHNAVGESIDNWMTTRSSGSAFAFMRWGSFPGLEEKIDPVEPAVGDVWKPHLGVMGDATMRYTLNLKPFQAQRLMHWTGVRPDAQSAFFEALSDTKAFLGLAPAVAGSIVNWGPDPDEDGVPNTSDACPATPGGGEPDGCPAGPDDKAPGDVSSGAGVDDGEGAGAVIASR